MRKEVPKAGRRVRNSSTPTVRNPTRTSHYTAIIYADDLGKTHVGFLIVGSDSVRLYRSRLVGSVGFFVVSLFQLAPSFLDLFHKIPQVPSNVWLCGFASVPISC